jgi:RNA recognition motif-containing protein
MTPIQQLYFVLRMKALKDPLIANLFQGNVEWNDAAASAEDEARMNEYLQTNDGAAYLSAINAELNRFHLHNQESNPTPPPSPILPPYTESLYNPKGVKTIIARNLPRDINTDELRRIFEKHGAICDIYIPKNQNQESPYYGTIKGFAIIKFLTSQGSTRAFMGETNDLVIRNKKVTVEFAKEDH